jgi:two-component system chemotaxis response regulator CheY
MFKVLVVDDSMMVRQQVSRALKEAGFGTLDAADGAEAMRLVAENGDIALVICDINMPNMGGLQFLGEAKKKAPNLPVVMLTTEGQPALIQQARALGARGWLIKPFKPEMLVAAAKKLAAPLAA